MFTQKPPKLEQGALATVDETESVRAPIGCVGDERRFFFNHSSQLAALFFFLLQFPCV
ncbi:hypothetical protein TSUD_99170 [Trifolium subterraneum]|uniref:Uncharacterized protein n=1 Tax=Trifolium subterraneum TaxID=3900 RepID=A0A2Z6PFZ8_TRISU|nr:hypothetical protein TSUD_99170 [Trifolium subterraneum]